MAEAAKVACPAAGWPPDLAAECRRRLVLLHRVRSSADLLRVTLEHCKNSPVDFINDWVWTHDPRPAAVGGLTHLPFRLFPRQEEFIEWLDGRLAAQESGLVEKSRELGVTWACAAYAVHGWRFRPGFAVGFGSRKEALVDRLGDMDSIFEKIRYIVDYLPREFLPRGFDPGKHSSYMKLLNPETGASITGEAGDNIGRGGRKTIYFKDESSHYERPMKIEASLSQNTNVQIDVSSVNGVGNPFHEKRMTWPSHKIFVFDWRDDPRKDEAWYQRQVAEKPAVIVAQEIDRDYGASAEGVVIPGAWVQAAVSLDLLASGQKIAGLDVADDGSDKKGFLARHGHVAVRVEEWQTGGATECGRKAWVICQELGVPVLNYEKEGVGAAVSGVARDLSGRGPTFAGISPGSTNLPGWYIQPSAGDKGKKNEDMFSNLKAMTWWRLRDRFQRTWEHVSGVRKYPLDELISLKGLRGQKAFPQLVAELSQPQYTLTESGKIKIVKTPSGFRSPNLADALMLSYAGAQLVRVGAW
jgi:hypothetical protein